MFWAGCSVLEHGGQLRAAAQHYGTPLEDWLDLSTGINPHTYPVPALDPACWNRLPEDGDGLEVAAASYYGNPQLLVLPGSQAAIQGVPALFRPGMVACVTPTYEEHLQAWERRGHKLRRLPSLARAMTAVTPYVLLCNPNNPTATSLSRADVLAAADQLRRRGGWLVVDEAFADPEPENSVAALAGQAEAPNLLVLRSLGKFFGLAGARVGFLLGAQEKLEALREMLGPWPVSHPARCVARHALADSAWQKRMRGQLGDASIRLAGLLAPLGEISRTPLFCTLKLESPDALYEHLAQRAILSRRFPAHGLLRMGLPGSEEQWQRVSAALAEWRSK